MRVSLLSLTLILVQVELIRRCPEPVHHFRTRWSIKLYSTTAVDKSIMDISELKLNVNRWIHFCLISNLSYWKINRYRSCKWMSQKNLSHILFHICLFSITFFVQWILDVCAICRKREKNILRSVQLVRSWWDIWDVLIACTQRRRTYVFCFFLLLHC